ncbi:hypothetical protein HUT16_27805 [Kitasatospora sp. NA04385]|uniref:hypothetical protein n=1 Tax=Kitasatospora sp. NA04385 TaxID=2742135 RepID=UPI00159233CD|nr:hypothetical protein [Kitasatospora sp. NA04385]QKW22380.1 hypothetical protein HUT16_27805 [Kitasatospora sp. NA04385]
MTARAIPWVGLPGYLWRLPFAFGFTMGTVQHESFDWRVSMPYVLTLSTVSECLALLCVGLVRGWGEVLPHRLPLIGGRRIPPLAAVVPAALCGLVLTWLLVGWVLAVFGLGTNLQYTGTGWQVLGESCQGVMVLWGPMLLAVTYAYWVRRRR